MQNTDDPVVVIADSPHYTLRSRDNGASYSLSSKEDNTSACIQGEDVAAFVQEYESIKTQYPGYTIDQVLAQLWDQGGYSWMAEPDEA